MTQVITLRLLFQVDDLRFYIYPVVLKNEDELILIDTGYPKFLPEIEKAFKEKGLDINQLKQVILTHHDHDHMGSVKELITKYPKVEVKCSKEQMPYILGHKNSSRIEDFEKQGEALEGSIKEDYNKFINMLKGVEHIDQVTPISGNDKLFDDVTVIETPGHMSGHLSLYVESEKVLICGDCLISEEGILDIAPKEFVMDEEAEIESLRKILDFDIHKVICYHGGLYTSQNLKEEIKEIMENGYV